ncbi:MAG TPA: Na/Pi cotransporter family protein [Steroidobacteraceae bacterium]|nr:Na/Pi cotransporter family protein [Steroidobacteraceae bacterium]
MSGTLVLISLSGYVGLLLWGTHMVSSGVQRGFGAALRRALERNLSGRWRAFFTGVGITTLLQSSTAVGLMATSFTAAGVMALAPALAVMLGANVGTALVAQMLSFNVAVVAPPLVLCGVLAFRWSSGGRVRNLGRAAIGLGLMLMALAGLQATLGPVENTPLLRSVLESLAADPLLAVLLAAIITWGCHSSVVMVLLVGSLAANHVINAPETLALVLGANVGGALPPMLHASTVAARRVPLGNLLVRLTGVLVLLPWLTPLTVLMQRLLPGSERLAVNFHLLFNLALAAAFLGNVDRVAAVLLRWLPDPPRPLDPGRPLYLERAAVDSASVALANAARETLRMSDLAAAMLDGALQLLRSGDLSLADRVMENDRAARQLGAAIRSYLAAIGGEQTLDDRREGAKVQEILAAVINFEHVGDIIANSLTDFTVKQLRRGQLLAPEEIAAVSAMNAELVESHRLALSVFLRGNRSDALLLLERKRRLLQLESDATALSVRILREAAAASRAAGTDTVGSAAEESGLLLRIVRDLRRVHSHLASFAYPVVRRPQRRASTRADDDGAAGP